MNNTDMWIVDIRGQKMGPMDSLQVVEGLINRQIRVMHRVSRDGDKFQAICNEEYFEQFIIKLIEKLTPLADKETALQHLEGDKKDFTELSGVHRIDVNSLGITEQLEHAKQLQRATNDLSMLRKILIEIRTNRKTIIQASVKPKQVEDFHPDDQDVYITESSNWNPFVGGNKYLVLLLFVAGAIFLGVDYQKRQALMEEQEREVLDKEAQISSQYGMATDSASKTPNIKDSSIIKNAQSLIGVAATGKIQGSSYVNMDGFMSQPNELRINGKVIKRSEANSSFESLLERASIRILEDNNKKAEELLLLSLKIPAQPKVQALALLITVAKKLDDAEGSSRLIRVRSLLRLAEKYEKSVKGSDDKLIFVKMMAHFYLQNQLGLDASFRQFVSVFPLQDSGSTLGYRSLTSWNSLLAECVNIYNSHRENAWANAMLVGCLMRSSKADKAEGYAGYAISKLRDQEDVKALAGYAFLQAQNIDAARDVLFEPLKGSKSKVAYRKKIQGFFCDQLPNEKVCRLRSSASILPKGVRDKSRRKKGASKLF